MKVVFTLLLVFIASITQDVFSQPNVDDKSIIDTSALSTWKSLLLPPAISDNGLFAGYIVNQGYTTNVLILTSTDRNWSVKISEVREYHFTSDSKMAVVLTKTGKLILYTLGNNKTQSYEGIISFKLISSKDLWLLILDSHHHLRVININSKKQYSFYNVGYFTLSANKKTLVLISSANIADLKYIRLSDMTMHLLGSFRKPEHLIISNGGEKIAIMCSDTNSAFLSRKLILFDLSKPDHNVMVEYSRWSDTLQIKMLEKFSDDGKRIFMRFEIVKSRNQKIYKDVSIWRYTDIKLLSQQKMQRAPRSYLFSIDIASREIRRIEQENEEMQGISGEGLFLKIKKREGDLSEEHWNEKARAFNYLYNTVNGEKILLAMDPVAISPDNRYVIGFNAAGVGLLVYNILSGKLLSLTETIESNFLKKDSIAMRDRERCFFAGWHKGNVLVYDNFDIWEVNPSHTRFTVNLTKEGRLNNLSFRLAKSPSGMEFKDNDLELLNTFNYKTKQNGFYALHVNNKAIHLNELVMDDCLIYSRGKIFPNSNEPVKAGNSDTWILKIGYHHKSPNYFITRDFKKFTPLSSEYPEERYRWYKSELVEYKCLNGETSQSILYKPENFDSTKKYPVIINYYESVSERLNKYLLPELSIGPINIPWFVSRDYIVCTPDILYQQNQVGLSALNAIEGLAKHLSKLSYVDSEHIAINGQSFAGYETNFTITHTDLFAAAVSSSGISNLTSAVGSLSNTEGFNFFDGWVMDQGRMSNTMWGQRDKYIDNSPVFFADKVKTPVLLLANENDRVVNYQQGLEFFLALRRLGKKAWLLQYNHEDHVVISQINQYDYTRKLEDFFGHYLSGQPMPEWMKPCN